MDGHEASQFEEEDGGWIVDARHYSATSARANSLCDGWGTAPERLTLTDDRVHLWRASLVRPPAELRDLRALLAPDEVERAARYHFNKDRDHFIAARGTLRRILSVYLNADPSRVCFSYSQYGKPSLAGSHGSHPLRFNLAHSHELALFAFTNNREIGVDVEYIRADELEENIAENFFSMKELNQLRSLSPSDRVEAFFNCWTRKEAYIKARGEGLSLPLDQFDVSLMPGEPNVTLNVLNDEKEAGRWSLQALNPADGYVGAIAVEGNDWQLDCWQG